MLLAGLLNASFAPPPDGMWTSPEVAFEMRRLTLTRTPHRGCPKGWPVVVVDWPKVGG